jgi:hypothetical protein
VNPACADVTSVIAAIVARNAIANVFMADSQKYRAIPFHLYQTPRRGYIGDVVQVRILKLPQQFVHAPVEAVVRSAHKVGFGAQAFQQAQRVELAIMSRQDTYRHVAAAA